MGEHTTSSSRPSARPATSTRRPPSTAGRSATRRRPSSRSRSGPDLATTDTTPTFHFTADDTSGGLVFRCQLGSSNPVVCTSPKTYTEAQVAAANNGTIAGEHTFVVTAEKPQPARPGAWSASGRGRSRTTPLPRRPWSRRPPGPRSTSRRPSSTPRTSSTPNLECALDGAAFGSCASAPDLVVEQSGLLPGEHTLRVRAIDPSLNFDATPVETTWTVVGPPVVDDHRRAGRRCRARSCRHDRDVHVRVRRPAMSDVSSCAR